MTGWFKKKPCNRLIGHNITSKPAPSLTMSGTFVALKRTVNSKLLRRKALFVGMGIVFLYIAALFYFSLPFHSYGYLSRTGWQWGMFVDSTLGADGKMHETGKSFWAGPLVFAYSYDIGIPTNSAPPSLDSSRKTH